MNETAFETIASAALVLKLDFSSEEFAGFAEDLGLSENAIEAVRSAGGQGDGSFVFFVVPVEAIISSCWLSPTNPFNNGLADRSQPRKLSYGHAN